MFLNLSFNEKFKAWLGIYLLKISLSRNSLITGLTSRRRRYFHAKMTGHPVLEKLALRSQRRIYSADAFQFVNFLAVFAAAVSPYVQHLELSMALNYAHLSTGATSVFTQAPETPPDTKSYGLQTIYAIYSLREWRCYAKYLQEVLGGLLLFPWGLILRLHFVYVQCIAAADEWVNDGLDTRADYLRACYLVTDCLASHDACPP
jgi:hypothetical protein